MKSSFVYAFILIATIALALFRVRSSAAASVEQPPPSAEAPAPAPAAAIASKRGWVGVLLANRSVDVSPRSASLVHSTTVRTGDTVKQGATLATLEARDKERALRNAFAAQKNQTERLARSKRLREESLISAEEAEAATFEAERKTGELDLARILVDDAIVRAPFDGTIVARFVEPGMHVAAGTPMFRLIDTRGARLRFGVPPETADSMKLGQTVRFAADATPEDAAPARITSISPEVDRSAGLVVIEADVGSLPSFRSGSQVSVTLP